jgi:D-alanine-D-alanine ligase
MYHLPPGKPRLLTFSAKWLQDDEYFNGTCEQCPAEIGQELQDQIGGLSAAAFTATGCRSYACVDLRQDEKGKLMVIDINPNPDISCEGSIKLPIQTLGMSYTAFIDLILKAAVRLKNRVRQAEKVKL